MSEVALEIGGRTYKVACAEGEEAHVTRLGAAIDAKLHSMAQLSAQDTQNLLFGALLLADELHDLRNSQTAAHDEAAQAHADAERHRGDAETHRAEAERLEAKLAELEREGQSFETLRGELEELREAETGLREELDAARSAEAELREQLAGLAQEQDALRGELDRAHNAPAAAAAPPSDPDLAPALERFAELLETCADKLEGHAAAS